MPKRRNHSKQALQPILRIFCEGTKTEPYYLNGYINDTKAPSKRRLVRVEPTDKNTPVQLVEVAAAIKDSDASLPADVFWVVYDREAINKYSEILHQKAFDKAIQNGINVALSNVCFERWLLLHFKNSAAPYSSYDDLMNQSTLKADFQAHTGSSYSKSIGTIYRDLKPLIPIARQRAINLNSQVSSTAPPGKAAPYQLNPYFGVPDLLLSIDQF